MPSTSLYWHTFGSLATALREAGFDVAVGEERLERAVDAGQPRSRGSSGRLPKFGDWQAARRADATLLTEWQVYRMFEARRGAWATFQFLVRERLLEEGATVAADGPSASASRAAASAARRVRQNSRSCGARTDGQRIVFDVVETSGRKRSRRTTRPSVEREPACPRAPRACAACSAQ